MNEVLQVFLTTDDPGGYICEVLYNEPELHALIETPQDPEYHPEGNALIHTILVVDEADFIAKREQLNPQDRKVLLLAALCHDLGKATHTQIHDDGCITSYGHDIAGVDPTKSLLSRLGADYMDIITVIPLVREHMAHIGYHMPEVNKRQVRRLMSRLYPSTIQMLAYLVEADMSGRGGKFSGQGLPQKYTEILHMADLLDAELMNYIEPLINGDDLIKIGFVPGKHFGDILSLAYQAQLDGEFTTTVEGIAWIFENVIAGSREIKPSVIVWKDD